MAQTQAAFDSALARWEDVKLAEHVGCEVDDYDPAEIAEDDFYSSIVANDGRQLGSAKCPTTVIDFLIAGGIERATAEHLVAAMHCALGNCHPNTRQQQDAEAGKHVYRFAMALCKDFAAIYAEDYAEPVPQDDGGDDYRDPL